VSDVSVRTYDYEAISKAAREALAREFPNSAIETEEGFGGRVQIKIVSSAFNGQSEKAKQGMVWQTLQRDLADDALAVSLIMPYGLDELP
jgi:stress-induced morphogen